MSAGDADTINVYIFKKLMMCKFKILPVALVKNMKWLN